MGNDSRTLTLICICSKVYSLAWYNFLQKLYQTNFKSSLYTTLPSSSFRVKIKILLNFELITEKFSLNTILPNCFHLILAHNFYPTTFTTFDYCILLFKLPSSNYFNLSWTNFCKSNCTIFSFYMIQLPTFEIL